jgi:putative membrane protein
VLPFDLRLQRIEGPIMTRLVAIALVAIFVAGGASAQTPQMTPDITNANPAAPVAGANSFTQEQARKRLQANGFTQVGPLSKDKDGIWRGEARKDGKTFAVAVDYQGNIAAK